MEDKELFFLFAYHSHSWHRLLLPLLLKHPVKGGKRGLVHITCNAAGIGNPTASLYFSVII